MDVNRSYLWPDIHDEERCVRLLICWLITEKSAFSTHAKFIWIVILIIIRSKYFAVSDWIQSPGKFFITNWPLLYLEDATNIPSIRWYISLETRFIDGIFAWKRGCLGNSELKKIAFKAIQRQNTCSWIYNSKLNGRSARIYPETMCF